MWKCLACLAGFVIVAGASSCTVSVPSVEFLRDSFAGGLDDRYIVSQVQQHFQSSVLQVEWRKDGEHTLYCVDDRSPATVIAVPGGDMAEFASATYVYLRDVFNKTEDVLIDDVRPLFVDFLNREITTERPFYFHTDDEKLRVAFERISQRIERTVSTLPINTPSSSEFAIWLDELSKSDVQGCGHITKMLQFPSSYGMSNNLVVTYLIQVFYEQFWAASNENKAKFQLDIKLGPHEGKAVGIVTSSTESASCEDYSPAVPPSNYGSSLFVYTPKAGTAFRSKVLGPFFSTKMPSTKAASFLTTIEALHQVQLNETLSILSPADSVDIFSVNFATMGYDP